MLAAKGYPSRISLYSSARARRDEATGTATVDASGRCAAGHYFSNLSWSYSLAMPILLTLLSAAIWPQGTKSIEQNRGLRKCPTMKAASSNLCVRLRRNHAPVHDGLITSRARSAAPL